MKNFTSADDCPDPIGLTQLALDIKLGADASQSGNGKTLGLVFFNRSLRTRMSTAKAAYNLGMNVMVLYVAGEAWNIEFEDGTVMDGQTQEHIKDAVKVMTGYCDIIGVRTFAELKNPEKDYSEPVLSAFLKYSEVPVVSLESATLHPLQSLADIVTIMEKEIVKPKVAVSWAPHPKTLPQAVINSFLQWITYTEAQVVLAHPEGYELKEEFSRDVAVTNHQQEALEEADFVYVKNWSSYTHYGEKLPVKDDWMITAEKMRQTNNGHFMHCLPVRRNVVAADEVIDCSLIYEQAKNREFAAQAVLTKLLEEIDG